MPDAHIDNPPTSFLVYESNSGRINWQGSCARLEVDLQISAFPDKSVMVIYDSVNQLSHYILDGEPTARPATGLPETHTIPASTDWIIPDVPAGTEVEIDGEVMGITDDTGLTLSFDAPGIWPVTLRPPFPWIAATCEVTVT